MRRFGSDEPRRRRRPRCPGASRARLSSSHHCCSTCSKHNQPPDPQRQRHLLLIADTPGTVQHAARVVHDERQRRIQREAEAQAAREQQEAEAKAAQAKEEAERRKRKRKRKNQQKKEKKKEQRRALAELTNQQQPNDDRSLNQNQLAFEEPVQSEVHVELNSRDPAPSGGAGRPQPRNTSDDDDDDDDSVNEQQQNDDGGAPPLIQDDPVLQLEVPRELDPEVDAPELNQQDGEANDARAGQRVPRPTASNSNECPGPSGQRPEGSSGEPLGPGNSNVGSVSASPRPETASAANGRFSGFIELDDATARRLKREPLEPAPGRLVRDKNGCVPYWTNESLVRYNGERDCVRDAWNFATGMYLGELGLLKTDITAARARLQKRGSLAKDASDDLSVGVVLEALRAARSPFQLRRCLAAKDEGKWSPFLSETSGVLLAHVQLDDGEVHTVEYDAPRRLLMLAAARSGQSNRAHVLRIEDADCDPANEGITRAKLKAKYGIVAPKFVYRLVVQHRRVAETLYGRGRRPGEKVGLLRPA